MANDMKHGTDPGADGCEPFLRALDRARDGAATPAEAASARAHAESCAGCRAAAAALDPVAARLRERGGPADAPAPAGLREAVMARVRRGDAVVLELHPFLRRAAFAAAALFLVATAAAFWQASRVQGPAGIDAGVSRSDVVALIVRLRTVPGR
jgi:hypothetical protein